jgi:2-hydroxy-6-oxonona-2,4-dienedioate hydrolase/2-hydroxy-6-oxo-6-(2'-carboxyphenyl)-hexa-2,4-dienoate hydrolase
MENSFWVDLLGATVRFVDAGGIRTRCIEAGEGDVLLMLHGSGGHAEAYARNVVPLSEHFHVYAIDMAGHGFTDRHPTLTGIESTADHVLRFMDAEGVAQSHLAGESMGGAVSAKIALEHPERVKKVVYITGAGLQMGEEADRLSAAGREAFQRLSAAAFGNPTRETVRDRLSWLFYDPEKAITDELLEVRYQIYSRRAGELAQAAPAGARQGGGEGRPAAGGGGGVGVNLTPERLREIKAPFLFLWTDHNPSTPWQVAEMAHKQMPGSRFHVVKHAGHWPQYEQTEEFNRLVVEFLKG